MPRVIHREITTIQITSVEVTWDNEREQVTNETVELDPQISELEKSAATKAEVRKTQVPRPPGRDDQPRERARRESPGGNEEKVVHLPPPLEEDASPEGEEREQDLSQYNDKDHEKENEHDENLP